MNKALATVAAALGVFLGGCSALPDEPTRAVTEYGVSTEGRTITVHFLGDVGPSVLVIGGIHGSEPEGLGPARTLVEMLRREPMRARVVVIEDLNPDGSVALMRHNARGVDLNRNWPASNFSASEVRGPEPLSEVETRFGDDLLRRIEPELVIVLHSIPTGPFVNHDGPARDLAEIFAEAADDADQRHLWDVRHEMGYDTPGSIGSYLGVDRGVATLTIEFGRGHDESDATAALLAGFEAVVGEVIRRREQ